MEKFTKKNHTANFTVETFACPSCTCSCNGCSCSGKCGDAFDSFFISNTTNTSSHNNDTSGGKHNQTF